MVSSFYNPTLSGLLHLHETKEILSKLNVEDHLRLLNQPKLDFPVSLMFFVDNRGYVQITLVTDVSKWSLTSMPLGTMPLQVSKKK